MLRASDLMLALGLGFVLLTGCPTDPSDDDDGTQDDDDDTGGDDDGADDDTDHSCGFAPAAAASFAVTERLPQTGEWTAVITGSVTDGVMPELYAVEVEEGGCRTLTMDLGICDPPCTYPDICTADAVCEPMPLPLAGGTLTVEGLAVPVAITPEEWNAGYYYDSPDTVDLFGGGDVVTAHLEGADFPPLILEARGVESLQSPFPGLILELFDGENAEVSWTPGGDPEACIQLQLKPQWYGHGQPMPNLLWCEVPDTGSLTIPAAVVTAHPHGETPDHPCITSACPWSTLTRYTRAGAETEFGPAEFVAQSSVDFRFRHLPDER